MSVNRYLPHVLVLPEDDANRQLANGFLLDSFVSSRTIQVLPEVGGWNEVLNRFASDHIYGMDRYNTRFVILLIDFDGQQDRLDRVKAMIPERLRNRVFILGTWSNPESLRQELGLSYETIGLALAKDCREETEIVWSHKLLVHNVTELNRLREHVRPILFSRRHEGLGVNNRQS